MIQEQLKKYLWDNEVDDMDMITYKDLIIARVLEHGILIDIKKLLSIYSKEDIIKTIKSSTEISKKTGYFWKYFYNIQGPLTCMKLQSTKKQKRLWPY